MSSCAKRKFFVVHTLTKAFYTSIIVYVKKCLMVYKRCDMMNYRLHTPEGVKDYLPAEYAFKKQIENSIQTVFDKYGYQAIDTPAFEFAQVYEGMGGVDSKRMHKLLDRDGSILGLRPDITPAIARIASTAYSEGDIPLKFSYIGNCFRYNENYQGKMREFTQAGIEFIGVNSAKADTEVLEAAINALLASGLKDFRIDMGDVAFLQGVLEEAGISASDCEKIRESIVDKNYVKVAEIASSLDIREDVKTLFADLPLLIGDISLLEKMAVSVKNQKSLAALAHLHKIYDDLKEKGLEKYISFDFGVVGQMDYYTGIVFRGYAYGSGFSIVDGGRYDNMVKNFGADYPAVGLSININNLMSAISVQSDENGDKYLTFALAKGRLADKAMALLETMGITCDEMKEDSRKLIFTNEELKLKFFLAKATDVPTYVESGAADIGFVGKDTLLEENRNLYEVYDLGFGKCKFAVAGSESAWEIMKHSNDLRVATKYPNVAKEHFYHKKHQTIEIVKLNGSVELAPIVGLSDVIVDIVETGSTLKANGLSVLEDVCPISARMVVNRVSMKLEHKRIADIIKGLRELEDK